MAATAAPYTTIDERLHRIGKTGYLEVSRKRLAGEDGKETDFILVTRGFFEKDGRKRWTRFVTIPDDPAARAWLADAIRDA